MNAALFLASAGRLTGEQAVESLLIFSALYAAVAFPFFAVRWRPLALPYFSKLFVLALCPFLFTSVVLFLHANQLLLDDADGSFPIPIGQYVRNPAWFVQLGGSATLINITLHTLFRFFSRRSYKTAPASLEQPHLEQI